MFVGILLRDSARDFGIKSESSRHREIFEISSRAAKTLQHPLKYIVSTFLSWRARHAGFALEYLFLAEELRKPRSDEGAGKTNRSPAGRGSNVKTKHLPRQLRRIILEPDCGLAPPDFVLTVYLLYLSQHGNYYL